MTTISFGSFKEYMADRSEKGNSLLTFADSYVAFDLETTGLDPTYNEIIEIAAVKVENNEVVSQYHSLVKPQNPVDEYITWLTGITNEMLESAPDIESVLPELFEFIGDAVVVAHNANFDVNFLYDKGKLYLDKPFTNSFIDTMRLSRNLYKTEKHHRLKDLVTRFGIADQTAHRAMDDTMQTIACYNYMREYATTNAIELKPASHNHSRMAADIKATTTDFDETTAVFGKTFVFTGTLEKMVRRDAMQLVANMGGLCADRVTKDTNYLVLGNLAYSKSIKDGKSSKQKSAEKLQRAGNDIEVISENVFYEMIAEQ